ncbi:MAG: hypothetical protein ACK47B_12355 [Armatimonadota bacterium]
MILSSYAINPWYFALVRPWITRVCLLMRQAENETLVAAKSRSEVAAKIFYALGHALKEPMDVSTGLVQETSDAISQEDWSSASRAFDALRDTLTVANTLPGMVRWLSERSPEGKSGGFVKDGLPHIFAWAVAPTENSFRCSLTTSMVRQRLESALRYAERSRRRSLDGRIDAAICSTLRGRGVENLVRWLAPSTLQMVRDARYFIQSSDPPAGAVIALVSELLVNAVRYNSENHADLRVVVAADSGDLYFLVANTRDASCEPCSQILRGTRSASTQTEQTGLQLMQMTISTLNWEAIVEDSASSGDFAVSRHFLNQADFEVASNTQVLGFRAPFSRG